MHVRPTALAAVMAVVAGTLGAVAATYGSPAAFAVTESTLSLAPEHGSGADPVTATFSAGRDGPACAGDVDFRWDRRVVGSSSLLAAGDDGCVASLTFTPPDSRTQPGDHAVEGSVAATGADARAGFTVDPADPPPPTRQAPAPSDPARPTPQPVRTTANPGGRDLSPAPGGQDFAAPAATGSAPAIPGTELSLGPAPAPAALGSPAVVRAAVDGAAGTPWAALLLGGALFTVGAVIAVWMMVRWRRHARTEAVYPEAGGAW